jgi:predicted phage terminase large subunit-like protein
MMNMTISLKKPETSSEKRAAAAATLIQVMTDPTEQARRRLIRFTEFTYPQYVVEPVHELIASTLDQVVRGHLNRVMIFAPPQHGKSELVSVRLPAYWLGKRPNDPVILASYAADLAQSKSRQARRIIESEVFGGLFQGVITRPDSRAVNHWELSAPYRGGMLAVGIGGPVTGHGARLGIIDDPFENWEQAQSPAYRNRAWEWWRTTFRTRIWEGGAIVIIMTRWHEDDLAGRILAEQPDAWTVLRLPAIAETQVERDTNNRFLGMPEGESDPLRRPPGEPLAPKRYSSLALLSLKADVGSMGWSAEYQGVPRPAEGNRFKRHWFPIVDQVPAEAKRIRYWDKAGTEGGEGARTAGVLVALTDEGQIYIESVVFDRYSALQREQVIKQTAILDASRYQNRVHIWIEQEPGSGGKESAESTIRNLKGFPIYADRPSGDKDTRLEPFAAQAEAGNVHLKRDPLWNQAYIEEMCAIPNGSTRDMGDSTAGAFNKLADIKSSMSHSKAHGLYPERRARKPRGR